MSEKHNQKLNPELDEIVQFLKKDEIRNCSHIGFINNYKISFFKKVNDTFLLKGKSDRDWIYLHCSNNDELELLLDEIENNKCFAVIEDWMLPNFTKRFKLKWKLSVLKYVFNQDIDVDDHSETVSKLSSEDAEYIFENSKYKEYLSIEYIKERINNGICAGIYFNNKLAAWALTQDDNAIGFLHVMDEHRGKGFAKILTEYMISQVRRAGLFPFSYIEQTNEPSIKLVEKLGFQKVDKVHWFEVE